MRKLRHWSMAIALLWVHAWLRMTDILVQDPYVDEGFHLRRATFIWTYDHNPGQHAGKLLAYYYYGLFETDPLHYLPVARWAMAILSLLTLACIYAITRQLGGRRIALVAMWIYALWPLTFFFERMAFADPIAAVCGALLMWRALAFAKHPAWWQGLGLGLLLAAATMAKLSMGLLPMVPVAATVLIAQWHGPLHWLRTYLPALVIAALVVIIIWAPLTLPLYLADPDYTITNPESFARSQSGDVESSLDYLEKVWPGLVDMSPVWFYQAAGAATIIVLLLRGRRGAALVVVWLLAVSLLNIGYTTLDRPRYFVPAAPAVAVIMALAIGRLWAWRLPLRLVGMVPLIALLYWSADFALPFHRTATTNVADLDFAFAKANWWEYQSNQLSADEAVRAAAATVNAQRQPDQPVYATWSVCHMLFFYVSNIECIPDQIVTTWLRAHTADDLAAGEAAYVVVMRYPDLSPYLPSLVWEKVAVHTRPSGVFPITVWRVRLPAPSP